MQSAWKVGLFVILFGVLIVMGYKLVGNSLFKKKADTYYGTFEDTGGIEPGAILTMVGVKVGTVTDVMLKSPKEAKMKLEITNGTSIPAEAVLSVTSNV